MDLTIEVEALAAEGEVLAAKVEAETGALTAAEASAVEAAEAAEVAVNIQTKILKARFFGGLFYVWN